MFHTHRGLLIFIVAFLITATLAGRSFAAHESQGRGPMVPAIEMQEEKQKDESSGEDVLYWFFLPVELPPSLVTWLETYSLIKAQYIAFDRIHSRGPPSPTQG